MIEGFAHNLRVDAALERSSGEAVLQVAHPDVAKHELRDEPSELMRDRLDDHRQRRATPRPVPLWSLMSLGSSQEQIANLGGLHRRLAMRRGLRYARSRLGQGAG
jgi:hypothetical protein